MRLDASSKRTRSTWLNSSSWTSWSQSKDSNKTSMEVQRAKLVLVGPQFLWNCQLPIAALLLAKFTTIQRRYSERMRAWKEWEVSWRNSKKQQECIAWWTRWDISSDANRKWIRWKENFSSIWYNYRDILAHSSKIIMNDRQLLSVLTEWLKIK